MTARAGALLLMLLTLLEAQSSVVLCLAHPITNDRRPLMLNALEQWFRDEFGPPDKHRTPLSLIQPPPLP